MIVNAEEVDDAVDDQEAVLARCEVLRQLAEQVLLELAIACPCDGDVVVSRLRIDAEAVSNLCNALWSKRPFGV